MDTRGWGYLRNSTKWHYFVDGRSLCGRWLRLSGDDLQDNGHDSPDNCAACRKVVAQRELAQTQQTTGVKWK